MSEVQACCHSPSIKAAREALSVNMLVGSFTASRIGRAVARSSRPQVRVLSSSSSSLMYDVIPKKDFGVYKEYSVIHTDRSLNLMSDPFQRVMRDLNQLLKTTYNADKVVIIPG